MRTLIFSLIVSLWTLGTAPAQQPDFAGTWILDSARSAASGVYGQVRMITQTAKAVTMTAIHYNDYARRYDVLPWTFRINEWGPRRPPESEPITQARWDGDKLIAVKSPGESYSVLWKWQLLASAEMRLDAIGWTNLPRSFDFRESSIPRYYMPDSYVYLRLADPPDTFFAVEAREVVWPAVLQSHDVSFRFQKNGAQLEIVCGGANGCTVLTFSNPPRTLARGESVVVPFPSRLGIQVLK